MKKVIYICTEQKFFTDGHYHYQVANDQPVIGISANYLTLKREVIEKATAINHNIEGSEIRILGHGNTMKFIVEDIIRGYAFYTFTITQHIVQV